MSESIEVARSELPDDYTEMMKTEAHHAHRIIRDSHGVLRWREDPFVNRLVDACGLNEMIFGIYSNGFDKNCEVYRELYRKMGYSLSGYWEVFYWEMNNEDAADYIPGAK